MIFILKHPISSCNDYIPVFNFFDATFLVSATEGAARKRGAEICMNMSYYRTFLTIETSLHTYTNDIIIIATQIRKIERYCIFFSFSTRWPSTISPSSRKNRIALISQQLDAYNTAPLDMSVNMTMGSLNFIRSSSISTTSSLKFVERKFFS